MNARITPPTRRVVIALAASALVGCGTPPTTIVRAGYSLPLPASFSDVTGPSIERHAMRHRPGEGSEVAVEPIMVFEGRSGYRNGGGCAVAKTQVPVGTTLSPFPLRALVRVAGSSLVQQWKQKGRDEPFNPWMPAQSIEPRRSGPATIAGLQGWQETWFVEWARQPGPIQPVSLMMVWLADMPSTNTLTADRPILQITCGTNDLPGYVDTALDEVVDVVKLLQPLPKSTPTAGSKP